MKSLYTNAKIFTSDREQLYADAMLVEDGRILWIGAGVPAEYSKQIAVHAMGGRAVDRVIDRVYGESDWTDGRVPFVRIEHVTEPSEEAMTKAAEKGYAFVTQPIFEYSEIETYKVNMDEQRLKQLYPFRTELNHGIQLALSTDAPATSWAVPSDPFSNIKAATQRSPQ